MIARSDLVILVISASALAIGVYRWHANTQPALPLAQQSPALAVTAAVATPVAYRSVSDRSDLSAATLEIVEVPASAQGQPVVGESILGFEATTSIESQSVYGTYEVRWGDYLYSIARKFGTDVNTLREINGISGSNILEGQKILYPLPAN